MTSSYIGLDPGYGAFEKQLLTGDGVTTTFDLDYPVGQAGQILVSLDGIVQEPKKHIQLDCHLHNHKLILLVFQQTVQEFLSYTWVDSYLQVNQFYLHHTLTSLVETVQQQHLH